MLKELLKVGLSKNILLVVVFLNCYFWIIKKAKRKGLKLKVRLEDLNVLLDSKNYQLISWSDYEGLKPRVNHMNELLMIKSERTILHMDDIHFSSNQVKRMLMMIEYRDFMDQILEMFTQSPKSIIISGFLFFFFNIAALDIDFNMLTINFIIFYIGLSLIILKSIIDILIFKEAFRGINMPGSLTIVLELIMKKILSVALLAVAVQLSKGYMLFMISFGLILEFIRLMNLPWIFNGELAAEDTMK